MTPDALYTLFEELFFSRGAIAAALLAIVVGLILWRLNKGPTPFRLGEALIDPMTGKASILRTGFFVCLVAAWGVVYFYVVQGLEIPASVQTTLLGVLGIFITPMIANRAFEIWDPRVKAEALNSSTAAAAVEAAKAMHSAPASQPAAGTTSTSITATAATTTEGPKAP